MAVPVTLSGLKPRPTWFLYCLQPCVGAEETLDPVGVLGTLLHFQPGVDGKGKKPAGTGHRPEICGLSDVIDLIRSFFRDAVLLPLRAARLLTLPYP